eukprot:Nitzschia sp. Nitz4//scaffold98_size77359//46788//47759//NITZ4_005550-RA/size77359-processed-gene-0.40-mRNA-1//-1//CDS//3329560763//1496//frame0
MTDSKQPEELPTESKVSIKETTIESTGNAEIPVPDVNNGEEDDAKAPLDSTSSPPLTKKQRKRLLKRQQFQEKKRQKKEERRAKAIEAGRDIEAEQRLQAERTATGDRKRRLDHIWNTEKLPIAQKSFQICLDCSFESLMQEREIASLAQQIRYCYSYNKKSPNPCLVSATSLEDGSETLQHLHKEAGFAEWGSRLFTCTNKSLEDYYANRKSKIVYLTSDSDTVLSTLDPESIYVIGGIVDRNRLKNTTLDRAKELGVATAQLPLDAHWTNRTSTPVLTCNHVLNILLKYREFGEDWAKALEEVLPRRKDGTFANPGDSKKE